MIMLSNQTRKQTNKSRLYLLWAIGMAKVLLFIALTLKVELLYNNKGHQQFKALTCQL